MQKDRCLTRGLTGVCLNPMSKAHLILLRGSQIKPPPKKPKSPPSKKPLLDSSKSEAESLYLHLCKECTRQEQAAKQDIGLRLIQF